MVKQKKSFLKKIFKTVVFDVIEKNTTSPSSFGEGNYILGVHRPDTDKFRTGLFQEYMEGFKDIQLKPITMLEIGICLGGSMFLWADFFRHIDSKIIGIDLRIPEEEFPPNVITDVCDQNDAQALRRIAEKHGPFDIVVDDGSHFASETRNSFEILFPYVKEGGYYAIEDWAVGYWKDRDKGYVGMVDVVTDIIKHAPNLPISSFKVSLNPHHSFSLFRKGETGCKDG